MRASRKLGWGIIVALVAVPALASELAVLHNGFTIRSARHEVRGAITRLYVVEGSGYVDVPTSEIDHFAPDPTPPRVKPATMKSPTSPAPLENVVANASSRQHLDPDLVNSVIHAESDFNPHAVSPKGAQGLMQLMPQTASRLGVDNAFDPKANVEGGTQYLRTLLERYHFDLVKALAAYNAGPQRVEQYGGVPPYRETRAYVARIVRDFNRKKLAEQKAARAKAGQRKKAASSATNLTEQASSR
jgi:soluble lytic murein transglycosylase-like protein